MLQRNGPTTKYLVRNGFSLTLLFRLITVSRPKTTRWSLQLWECQEPGRAFNVCVWSP